MSPLSDVVRKLRDATMGDAPEPRPASPVVHVVADANHPTADVCVLDSTFAVVGQATGRFEGDLRPGLYVFQYKAGRTVTEVAVAVQPGQSTHFVPPPALATRSSAPLAGTVSGGRFGEIAARHSIDVHERRIPEGSGGQLYVFARDAVDAGIGDRAAEHRLFTLRLCTFAGDPIIDVNEQGPSASDGTWSACNVALAAGNYLLRCDLGPAGVFAQTIAISEGWQTQVFYSPRTYDTRPSVRGPDAARAAIFMARTGTGFDYKNPTLGWIEAGRHSLAGAQPSAPTRALWEAVNAWRRGDTTQFDPMFSIIGAHLLLLEREPDRELLQALVDILGRVVPGHPDVAALRLALPPASDLFVHTPPMLRASWDLIVHHSQERPDLVRPDSYAASIVGRTWGGAAWLIWKEGADGTRPKAPSAPVPATEAARESGTGGGTAGDSALVRLMELLTEAVPRQNVDQYVAWQAQRLQLNAVQRRLLTYVVAVARQAVSTADVAQARSSGRIYDFIERLRGLVSSAGLRHRLDIDRWGREERGERLSRAATGQALGMPAAVLQVAVTRLAAAIEGEGMMAIPKVCFDRILPRDLTKVRPAAPVPGARTRAAYEWAKLWPLGQPLRVSFLGGSPEQHALVKRFAPKWSEHANIKFVFGQDPNAEIRIAFAPNDGSWSYIGTDCKDIPSGQPTMNLGWQDEAVILHEFGHAIGLIHEHQNPTGGIKWNKPAVYRDLAGPPNYWNEATVDRNLFQTYDNDQVNSTKVDKHSIMLYVVPASWTLDGWSSKPNEVLSAMDKKFAGDPRNYPFTGKRQPPA